MIELVKPSDDEIRLLARREASTRGVDGFSPLCLGPWGNAALLLGIGILAACWTPARLIARIAGRRKPHSEDAA
jgi:hypothetical protein